MIIDLEQTIKDFKDIRLLFVEDNKFARESTLVILEEFFENITIAVDGEDGLQKYTNSEFDLVITDINMPKMDGIDMSKAIRVLNKDIPIIILSAHNEEEYLINSIKIGTSTYLSKPIEIENFLLAVYEATHQSKKELYKIDEKQLDKYIDKIDQSSIVSILDKNGIIIYVNEFFSKVFGYKKEDILGKPYYTLSKEEQDYELTDEIWHSLKVKKESWSGTIRYINNFDKVYFLRGTIKPIMNEYDDIILYVAVRENITSLVEKEIKILSNGVVVDG